MYRYYSTQRPIGSGTIPTKPKPTKVENFVGRTFVESIGKQAWGYVEYSCELPTEKVAKWELTPEKAANPNLDICLVALAATEAYRLKGGKNDPTDYAIRVCQSILAEAFGFNNRVVWTEKIQSEGLLNYGGDYKQQYNSLIKLIIKEE